MTQTILIVAASALSLLVGYAWGLANGRGKCKDKKHFDGCAYVVREIWENVTVEVCQCKKCGNVDISWRRQNNTKQIYKGEGK